MAGTRRQMRSDSRRSDTGMGSSGKHARVFDTFRHVRMCGGAAPCMLFSECMDDSTSVHVRDNFKGDASSTGRSNGAPRRVSAFTRGKVEEEESARRFEPPLTMMRPALSFLVGLVALFGACFAPHATAWTTSVSLPTTSRHAISPLRRATITAATAAPAQPVIQKERVLKRAPNSKLLLFDDPVRPLAS